jgi:prevent-host-death family protein
MTQTIKASAAREQWHQLLDRIYRADDRVVVEKSGIPVAAVISVRDLARLKQLEAERAERFAALDASWDAFKDVPVDEVEEEVTAAVSLTRQRHRKGHEGRS